MSKDERTDHATSIIPENPLMALRAFVLVSRSRGLRPYTVTVYERSIRRLCTFLAARELDIMTEISASDLREFFLELQRDHSKGGVEVFYRPIHAFFTWYWDEYEINGRNPIDRVKVEHQKVNPKPGIPLADFELMVQSCRTRYKLRDQAILRGLLDTCARATEFCNFRIRDVDYSTGRTWIEAGKGDKSRAVRFGSLALRSLRRYLKTRPGLRDQDPLFLNDLEEPFDRWSLRHLINRRADDAGVSHPGLHDFRRRGAYLMWQRTRDLKAVSEYLGHSSATVTERYLAIEEEDVLEAHRRGGPVDGL